MVGVFGNNLGSNVDIFCSSSLDGLDSGLGSYEILAWTFDNNVCIPRFGVSGQHLQIGGLVQSTSDSIIVGLLAEENQAAERLNCSKLWRGETS